MDTRAATESQVIFTVWLNPVSGAAFKSERTLLVIEYSVESDEQVIFVEAVGWNKKVTTSEMIWILEPAYVFDAI